MLSNTTFSAQQSAAPLPLLPEEFVATSSHMQQFSAVRKLTRDLQQQKPRHRKRPQLPSGEAGTPTKRIRQTGVYKQKLNQYNEARKHFEQYIDQLLSVKAAELTKLIINVDAIVNNLQTPSKLAKLKSPIYNLPHLSPLRIHISPIIVIIAFSAIAIAVHNFPIIIVIIHLFPYLPHPRRSSTIK